MDLQLIKQATSHVEPAKKELQPLNSGVQEFEQALQGLKVCNASLNELQQVLRRCFVLVGIRANNLPSPEETQVLTAFIYKKYAGLTLQEIQIAFEKAVAGELDCEANCYENFSPAYFGQIMAAYKKWASQQFNENQMYVVKPLESNLLTLPADWKEMCEVRYQDYLIGALNLSVMPYQLYDEFVKCEMMDPTAFEDFINKAYNSLESALKLQIFMSISQSEKNELQEYLSKLENGEYELKIEQQAKKLAVQFLYKTAKGKGFKNLFIKE